MPNSGWRLYYLFKSEVWQNSKYFLVSDEILFLVFIMVLLFFVNIVQSLDMSIFKSPNINHSVFNIFCTCKLR